MAQQKNDVSAAEVLTAGSSLYNSNCDSQFEILNNRQVADIGDLPWNQFSRALRQKQGPPHTLGGNHPSCEGMRCDGEGWDETADTTSSEKRTREA